MKIVVGVVRSLTSRIGSGGGGGGGGSGGRNEW